MTGRSDHRKAGVRLRPGRVVPAGISFALRVCAETEPLVLLICGVVHQDAGDDEPCFPEAVEDLESGGVDVHPVKQIWAVFQLSDPGCDSTVTRS